MSNLYVKITKTIRDRR